MVGLPAATRSKAVNSTPSQAVAPLPRSGFGGMGAKLLSVTHAFEVRLVNEAGHINGCDEAQAVEWLTKAADASHVQARRLLEKVNTARAPADVASTVDVILSP